MQLRIQPTSESTAADFASFLKEKLQAQDVLHLALSGGSTPKLLFDHMTAHADDFPWERLYLYWGDERCVAPNDTESNYRMTNEHLLSKVPLPKENIHRIMGENEPKIEAVRYGELLANTLPKQHQLPVFDVIMLGMGSDGHTASIFPHEAHLLKENQICGVGTHPESGQKRITLTGPTIKNAKCICFLVTGAGKQEKLSAIYEQTEESKSYPAADIASGHQNVIWFVDTAAAALIPPA